MNIRQVAEGLVTRVDLRTGLRLRPSTSPTDRVLGLPDLVQQLEGTLVPVPPDPVFRQRLHDRLVREAWNYQTGCSASSPSVGPEGGLFRRHRKGILIGAAAVGSVASVVGVAVACVLRYRHGKATHIATG